MKIFYILLLLISSLYSQDVEKQVSYFEQKNITQDINILSQEFHPLNLKHSNFGFSNSIFWIKIDIASSIKKSQQQVLNIPYALLDYIDIYELKNNQLTLQREFGDLRVYQNDSFSPDPSFIFELMPNQSRTFLLKIQTQGSMNIGVIISNYAEFVQRNVTKTQAFTFYFGAAFIMIIYNLILFLFIRNRSYFFYIIFHIDYLIFALALNGYAPMIFWPESPEINNYAVPLFMSIGSSLAVLFTLDFLQIKEKSPKLFYALSILFVINILATILVFVLNYHQSSLLTSLISILSIIIILASSAYSHYVSHNPYAKFFALAWGILLAGIFTIHLKNLGFLPVNIFTSYAAFIGAFFELTLLSIALAYHYNVQREELALKDKTLYRQAKFASMGEMISHIAHQWRQPLNRVNLSLAVIERVIKSDTPDYKMIEKKLKSSEENIQYMSDTIEDFANYFSPNKAKENFNIIESIQKAITLLEGSLNNINIILPKNKVVNLYGYSNEYLQVILVILNNAIDNFLQSNIHNKIISISVEEDEKNIFLYIEDNGGGIKKEYIDKIFDPYFTTKFQKEGTGLGLYMAKMVIENSMYGKLDVKSEKDTTIFTIIGKK